MRQPVGRDDSSTGLTCSSSAATLIKQVVQNGVKTAGQKGNSVFTQGSGANRIRVIVENRTGDIITVTKGASMRLTYDRDADAAYLMLVDNIAPGEAVHQVQVADDDNVAGQVILDFGPGGKLLGLEVLFASDALPPSVLAAAEPL